MRRFAGTVALILCFSYLSAQEAIQWVEWEVAMKAASPENEKKFIVDLYTDWCGWCKKMDLTTFKDPIVQEVINAYYIPIKFNAETREDIKHNGKVYSFTRGGRRGYHKLAAEITSGRLSYPTLVFMDEKAEVIQAIPGYQDACTLEKIMTYFSGDFHKNTPWVLYESKYQCGEPDVIARLNSGKNRATLVGQKKN